MVHFFVSENAGRFADYFLKEGGRVSPLHCRTMCRGRVEKKCSTPPRGRASDQSLAHEALCRASPSPSSAFVAALLGFAKPTVRDASRQGRFGGVGVLLPGRQATIVLVEVLDALTCSPTCPHS